MAVAVAVCGQRKSWAGVCETRWMMAWTASMQRLLQQWRGGGQERGEEERFVEQLGRWGAWRAETGVGIGWGGCGGSVVWKERYRAGRLVRGWR